MKRARSREDLDAEDEKRRCGVSEPTPPRVAVAMPADAWVHVMSYMPLDECAALARCCRRLREIVFGDRQIDTRAASLRWLSQYWADWTAAGVVLPQRAVPRRSKRSSEILPRPYADHVEGLGDVETLDKSDPEYRDSRRPRWVQRRARLAEKDRDVPAASQFRSHACEALVAQRASDALAWVADRSTILVVDAVTLLLLAVTSRWVAGLRVLLRGERALMHPSRWEQPQADGAQSLPHVQSGWTDGPKTVAGLASRTGVDVALALSTILCTEYDGVVVSTAAVKMLRKIVGLALELACTGHGDRETVQLVLDWIAAPGSASEEGTEFSESGWLKRIQTAACGALRGGHADAAQCCFRAIAQQRPFDDRAENATTAYANVREYVELETLAAAIDGNLLGRLDSIVGISASHRVLVHLWPQALAHAYKRWLAQVRNEIPVEDRAETAASIDALIDAEAELVRHQSPDSGSPAIGGWWSAYFAMPTQRDGARAEFSGPVYAAVLAEATRRHERLDFCRAQISVLRCVDVGQRRSAFTFLAEEQGRREGGYARVARPYNDDDDRVPAAQRVVEECAAKCLPLLLRWYVVDVLDRSLPGGAAALLNWAAVDRCVATRHMHEPSRTTFASATRKQIVELALQHGASLP